MQFLESLKEYGCNIDVGLDRLKGKTDFYKRLISKFQYDENYCGNEESFISFFNILSLVFLS